jgi:hypothetical protein
MLGLEGVETRVRYGVLGDRGSLEYGNKRGSGRDMCDYLVICIALHGDGVWVDGIWDFGSVSSPSRVAKHSIAYLERRLG